MLIDAALNNYMQCCLNGVQHETINLVILDSERTVLFRLEYDSNSSQVKIPAVIVLITVCE